MLGMFHLLPLLKGWEYKIHTLERASVRRGAPPIEQPISEMGWLMWIAILSDDCYGTFGVDFQGADLETRSVEANAEAISALGALAQDPGGWVQKYFRPNPASTAGIFVTILFSGGFQGSVWPYVPTVKMKIRLPEESTQESAYIDGTAFNIAITDPKLFLVSLRKILGIKGKLDPKLLGIGPVPLEEEQ